MKKRLLILTYCVISSLVSPIKFSYPQEVKEIQIIESLEFREVDIKDVLRQLAKQFGLNIVFSKEVEGLITVQLSNVTLDEALDAIITVNGFVYIKKEDIIKVITPEAAEKLERQTKLFKLKNADAVLLKETLSKILSPTGTIEADGRSNSLIVTDTLSVINKIQRMIPSLDEIPGQVLIEAKIIETSLSETEKLGIDWSTTITARGARRPTTAPFKAKSHMGMEEFLPLSEPTTDFPHHAFPYGFPYAIRTDFTFGILDFTSLAAIFDFLKTRHKTKLIASPRVLTLNNQKATIHVGKSIPIAVYELDPETGEWRITGWGEEPQKVGISLEVTPLISPDGYIRLRLKPEISDIFDWIEEEGKKLQAITSTRTAETEVWIKDGETVVIGGLLKDKSITKIKKIPILGDIPLIRLLFTRKEIGTEEEPQEQSDLLVFITATIVKEREPSLVTLVDKNLSRPFKLELRDVEAYWIK